VITLGSGLIGFPEETRFVLLQAGDGQSISWLQSLRTPALAFPVIDGRAVAPGYDSTNQIELARLANIDSHGVSVLVIVAARAGGAALIANLLAPIVIDSSTRMGAQVVLDSAKYSPSTPICAVAA
jgi:flagellar assembly factor FliW